MQRKQTAGSPGPRARLVTATGFLAPSSQPLEVHLEVPDLLARGGACGGGGVQNDGGRGSSGILFRGLEPFAGTLCLSWGSFWPRTGTAVRKVCLAHKGFPVLSQGATAVGQLGLCQGNGRCLWVQRFQLHSRSGVPDCDDAAWWGGGRMKRGGTHPRFCAHTCRPTQALLTAPVLLGFFLLASLSLRTTSCTPPRAWWTEPTSMNSGTWRCPKPSLLFGHIP